MTGRGPVPDLLVAIVVWAVLALGLVIGCGAAVGAPSRQVALVNLAVGLWAGATLAHRAGTRLGDSQATQRRQALTLIGATA